MEENSLLKEIISRINLVEFNRIMFIGGCDTGKTTLIKELANLILDKEEVIIFDCDIGQSHIGPPTTVGYAKIREKISDFYLEPDIFYFVGATSPCFVVIEFLAGIARITQFLNFEKSKILIDTTGYIKDKLAISLKIHKIEILRPDLVILLEKEENELEDIERFIRYFKTQYIKIKVKNIPSKSIYDRTMYRRNLFMRYFCDREEIKLSFKNLSIKLCSLRHIKNFDDIKNIDIKGNLCSLRDSNFNDLCLGIIKEISDDYISLLVPKRNLYSLVKGINISNFNLKNLLEI